MNTAYLNNEKLLKHLNLVLDANKKVNLTSITDFKEAQVLHIEDSLSALDFILEIEEGELVDIGSGAGFPGIPLAISSNKKTKLVETVGKKADCLKSFILQLGVDSLISVYNGRSEELATLKRNYYKIATARALSSLSSILELASPLLCNNGYLICYKSTDINKEFDEARQITNKLGFEYHSTIPYCLSNGQERILIVYKKIKEAEIKLPRKFGFAQKKPLM